MPTGTADGKIMCGGYDEIQPSNGPRPWAAAQHLQHLHALTHVFFQRKPTPCLSLSCGCMVSATSLNQWPRTLIASSRCCPSTAAAMAAPAALARRSWRVCHRLRSAEFVAVSRFRQVLLACAWAEDQSYDSPVSSLPWTDLGWDPSIPLLSQCWCAALIFWSHSTTAISATTASRSCQCRPCC